MEDTMFCLHQAPMCDCFNSYGNAKKIEDLSCTFKECGILPTDFETHTGSPHVECICLLESVQDHIENINNPTISIKEKGLLLSLIDSVLGTKKFIAQNVMEEIQSKMGELEVIEENIKKLVSEKEKIIHKINTDTTKVAEQKLIDHLTKELKALQSRPKRLRV